MASIAASSDATFTGMAPGANIAALLYVVIVLIGMVIFVPFTLLASIAGSQYGDGSMGAMMGAGVVGILLGGLFAAVIYGVIGWIMTALIGVGGAIWLFTHRSFPSRRS